MGRGDERRGSGWSFEMWMLISYWQSLLAK